MIVMGCAIVEKNVECMLSFLCGAHCALLPMRYTFYFEAFSLFLYGIYNTLNIPPELIVPFDSCCCWSCCCCCCCYVRLSRVSLWCFACDSNMKVLLESNFDVHCLYICSFRLLYSLHTFVHLHSYTSMRRMKT